MCMIKVGNITIKHTGICSRVDILVFSIDLLEVLVKVGFVLRNNLRFTPQLKVIFG